MTSLTRIFRRSALAFAALGTLSVMAAPGAAAQGTIDPKWLTVNSSAKMVILALTGSATPANNGLNFNGFADGNLTMTVPTGWRVIFYYHNKSESKGHHPAVVPYASQIPDGVVPPAFKGAETGSPGYLVIPNGRHTVNFKAERAGEFLLICENPTHASQGEYIRFNVSDEATVPTLTAK